MCVHAAKAFRVDLLAIATCSVECVDGFEPSNSFTSDEFCSQVAVPREETLCTLYSTRFVDRSSSMALALVILGFQLAMGLRAGINQRYSSIPNPPSITHVSDSLGNPDWPI